MTQFSFCFFFLFFSHFFFAVLYDAVETWENVLCHSNLDLPFSILPTSLKKQRCKISLFFSLGVFSSIQFNCNKNNKNSNSKQTTKQFSTTEKKKRTTLPFIWIRYDDNDEQQQPMESFFFNDLFFVVYNLIFLAIFGSFCC